MGITMLRNGTARQGDRGWLWAYRKIRSWFCSPVTAAFRATVYVVFGSTGTFLSHHRQRKSRITRASADD